jgi:hypothetical protein
MKAESVNPTLPNLALWFLWSGPLVVATISFPIGIALKCGRPTTNTNTRQQATQIGVVSRLQMSKYNVSPEQFKPLQLFGNAQFGGMITATDNNAPDYLPFPDITMTNVKKKEAVQIRLGTGCFIINSFRLDITSSDVLI